MKGFENDLLVVDFWVAQGREDRTDPRTNADVRFYLSKVLGNCLISIEHSLPFNLFPSYCKSFIFIA
jgi:hypothetical protein